MLKRRKQVKHMSAEELKSKLHAHFDKTGILNKMRTELRGKLVTELFKITTPIESPNLKHPTSDFDKTLLPLQVCNWLVYDHLLRQGYQYALSTFVSEANLPHPEELLTACDILKLFGLDNNTPEYKSISRMYSTSSDQDLLHSLLMAVIKSLFDFTTTNDDIKNNGKDPVGISMEKDPGNTPLFNKFGATEYHHVQEYPDAFIQLTNKSVDSNFDEQVRFVKEEKDREVQALRHKLMQEIDRLHIQESKLRREIENERWELKRKHDTLTIEKEKLKEKELILAKEHENKIEKKIKELNVDFISKIHAKEKELENTQGKLYDKEVRLAQAEADFSSLQGNYNSARKELDEMRHTYSALLDENTNLLRKFESMSDYLSLKGDLEVKSKEIKNLQCELMNARMQALEEKKALQEKIRSLDAKLKISESQLSEAQRQLNVAKDTLRMEEATWHKEKRRLEQESQEMYKTLVQRLEEQKDDIQALHHTIHILHYKLTDTSKRNQSKTETSMPYSATIKLPETSGREADSFAFNKNSKDSISKHKESLRFIEEAKNKINELQQQRNTWQDKSSMVYCSLSGLPDFTFNQNMSASKTTSHLTETIRIQSQRRRLENLIKNEMPTLDSSVPTEMKTQLANTLSSICSPITSNLPTQTAYASTTHVPSVNYSSRVFNQSLSRPNIEFRTSNNLLVSQPTETLKLPQTGDVEKNLSNDDYEKCSLFNLSNQKEENISTHIVLNTPVVSLSTQHNESFQEESVQPLQNIASSSVKNTEIIIQHTNANVENEIELLLQNPKTRDKDSKSDSLKVIASEAQVTPDLQNTLLVTEKDNLGPQSTNTPGTKVNTGAAIDLDAASKQNSSSKDVSESIPQVLVDLDSAWKRKSSLKENSDLQSVPSILANLDSTWKRRTSLISSSNPIFHKNSVINKNVGEKIKYDAKQQITDETVSEKEHSLAELKDEDCLESNMKSPNKSLNEKINSKIAELELIQDERNPPQDLQSKSKILPTFELRTESNNDTSESSAREKFDVIKSTKKLGDSVSEKNNVVDCKKNPEDSLSELSEIHLSCGSEQEQQKDDSDNW